jgi:hypothetical protein
MNNQKFWFIASSPAWPDDAVLGYEGGDRVDAPVPLFYSTREKAEAEQRAEQRCWNEAEWEDAPCGELEAYTEPSAEDESPNLEVFAMKAWLLAAHPRGSGISHVKLDDEVISADDFLAGFLD